MKCSGWKNEQSALSSINISPIRKIWKELENTIEYNNEAANVKTYERLVKYIFTTECQNQNDQHQVVRSFYKY